MLLRLLLLKRLSPTLYRFKLAGIVALLLVLAACTDKREELRQKQQEILRQQSSKWTEEQNNYRLPELGNKSAPKQSEQKGTKP
jgi:hypothetical protein